MSDTSGGAPAGWYPDPAGSRQLRWWNGVEWTTHFAPATQAQGSAAAAPATPPRYGENAAPAQQYGTQPYGAYPQQGQYGQTATYQQHYASTRPQLAPDARIYNVYIWLVVALPLLGVLLLPFMQPNISLLSAAGTYRAQINAFDVFGPVYIATVLLGLISYGLTVLFAWLDYRELEKIGVVRPFHWAWAFLHTYVYLIGRTVIVHQVAPRRGLAPIWAAIGVVFLSVVISMIWALSFASNLMHSIPPGGSNLGA